MSTSQQHQPSVLLAPAVDQAVPEYQLTQLGVVLCTNVHLASLESLRSVTGSESEPSEKITHSS